jgi:hypothetical protein
MTTETTHAFGMLCDYATSTPIRPATAIEWRKSADAELEGGDVNGVFDAYSGAFRDDGGHAVIVIGGPPSEVTADDIRVLRDEAASAGDLEQVRLCEVATGDAADSTGSPRGFARGNGPAFRECGKVILGNRMRVAEDATAGAHWEDLTLDQQLEVLAGTRQLPPREMTPQTISTDGLYDEDDEDDDDSEAS